MSKKNNNQNKVNRELAKQLHSFYKEKNIGIETLGKIIGVHSSMISWYFRGDRGFTLPVAIRVAKVIGYDLNKLKELDKEINQKNYPKRSSMGAHPIIFK